MFGLFKKKKEISLNEYSFVWYKKMVVKNKSIYTQPFRTKIKAKNLVEAKEKLTNFALTKMELIIINEDNDDDSFKNDELNKINGLFNEFNDKMNNLFNKHQNHDKY